MTTLTASQIADLHARRTAKGAGYAPPLAECLAAARAGRLVDVDTASAGFDGLTIADDAETALAEWAAATVGPVDGEGDAARFARWTAERVTLDVAGSALAILRAAADERARMAEAPAAELGVGHAPTDAEALARRATYASGSAVLRALASHLAARVAEYPDDAPAAVRRVARAAGAVCSATGESLRDLAGPETDED